MEVYKVDLQIRKLRSILIKQNLLKIITKINLMWFMRQEDLKIMLITWHWLIKREELTIIRCLRQTNNHQLMRQVCNQVKK